MRYACRVRAWMIGFMLLVPTATAVASCTLGDFTKASGPTTEADAGEDGGCGHATVPLPAAADNEGGPPADTTEFVVALHAIRLVNGPGGTDLGLDLDRFCSCQGESGSCVPPKGQDPDSGVACDLAQGRDNQMPILFSALGAAFQLPDLSPLYSDFAHNGGWSLLMRIRNYNGQANDPQVHVAWYAASADGNKMPPNPPPKWDGTDMWPIVEDSVDLDAGDGGPFGFDTPRYFDNNAYVVDNKLVFSLPSNRISIAGGQSRFAVKIVTGTAIADIQKNAMGQYVLRNGVLAGRIPVADLFQMLSDFRTDQGSAICANDQFYKLAKYAFCTGLDIQTGPAVPQLPCDAASIAIGFDSDPAQLGYVIPADPVPSACPPGLDPSSEFADSGCGSPSPI